MSTATSTVNNVIAFPRRYRAGEPLTAWCTKHEDHFKVNCFFGNEADFGRTYARLACNCRIPLWVDENELIQVPLEDVDWGSL